MKKIIYVLRLTGISIIFLLLCLPAWAQPGILQGWVRDKKGNPLAGASVTIKGIRIGTATDLAGHFKLKLPPGKYVLTVTFIDHSALQERITITKGASVKKNFTTAEVYKQCREVVVLCPRPKQRLTNISNVFRKDSVSTDMNTMSTSDTVQSKMSLDSVGIKYLPLTQSFNRHHSGSNTVRPEPYFNVSRQSFLRVHIKWTLDPKTIIQPRTIHALYDFSIHGVNRRRNY